MEKTLLEIKDLKTYFYTRRGIVKAVDGVSFDIDRQKTLGIVGESGCGKSVTARSILKLIPPPGKIVGGRILYYGENGHSPLDLVQLNPKGKRIRHIRGKEIAMIFQESMSCLSPVHTIGNQIIEAIRLYEPGIRKEKAKKRAIGLLKEVGIPGAEKLINAYTFELSGGIRQRALIAVSLAGEPKLLIADEPTTAIDVTIQAKFLDLLRELQSRKHMAVLFITHNMGIVAEMAKKVIVMYLGRIAEKGSVEDIFDRPKHPYTKALLKSIPSIDIAPKETLATIKGSIASPYFHPPGCLFSNRCPQFMKGVCNLSLPPLIEIEEGHQVSCFLFVKHNNKKMKKGRE